MLLRDPLLQHEQLERDQEKLVVLTTPLGKDRFHNRYWFFSREGRLFVESDDSSRWGYYAAKEEVTLRTLYVCGLVLEHQFSSQKVATPMSVAYLVLVSIPAVNDSFGISTVAGDENFKVF